MWKLTIEQNLTDRLVFVFDDYADAYTVIRFCAKGSPAESKTKYTMEYIDKEEK